MASEADASHSKSILPKQAHEIGRALVEIEEQVKKPTQDVEQVRGTDEAMMLVLLTSHTLHLMKT